MLMIKMRLIVYPVLFVTRILTPEGNADGDNLSSLQNTAKCKKSLEHPERMQLGLFLQILHHYIRTVLLLPHLHAVPQR